MAIRVTLDSTLLVNTPIGWDDADIKSKRDNTIKGLFVEYTTDLEFYGDGFDYIDNAMSNSTCDTIDVLIETNDCDEGVWQTEFNGIIQLTQITSYDVDKRIIKTKILDESFDAKIDNNKSIKAFVDVPLSKNNKTITAATAHNIKFFLPTAKYTTYIAETRVCYRIYDCFRFIIDYMTDGNVDFVSDIFSTDYYDWMLVNGKEVRLGNGQGNQVEVSFKELFIELDKKTNLSFAIEPSSGYSAFQLRLEPTSYFESDVEILTLNDVLGIMMSFDRESLYSHVEIGSQDYDDDVYLSYPPINFKAFKEENYTIQGNCNIDKGLNLVSKYIIDTNVIEKVLTTGALETKYDKKIFIVVTDGTKCVKYKEYDNPIAEGTDDGGVAFRLTDSTATFVADGVTTSDMIVNMTTGVATSIISVDAGGTFITLTDDIFVLGDEYQVRDKPFNYNDPLTNIRVITRFLGGLPNNVIKQYSLSATSNFRAATTTGIDINTFPTLINKINYDDDFTPPFFDDGANYSIVDYEYTIPSSGLYGFKAVTPLRLNALYYPVNYLLNGEFDLPFGGWLFNSSWGNINTTTQQMEIISNFMPVAQLMQQHNFTSDFYKLEIFCLLFSGQLKVNFLGTEYWLSSGHNVFYFDLRNTAPVTHFLIIEAFAPPLNIRIDYVRLTKTPRFEIFKSIVRRSIAGVELQRFTKVFNYGWNLGEMQRDVYLRFDKTFPTFAGEKISVELNVTVPTLSSSARCKTIPNSITDFKTILTEDGGGGILPVDPDTFPIFEYKFEKAIKYSEFKEMKDNPSKSILFSKGSDNHIYGYRNDITYSRKTGICKFNLRSKSKINGDC